MCSKSISKHRASSVAVIFIRRLCEATVEFPGSTVLECCTLLIMNLASPSNCTPLVIVSRTFASSAFPGNLKYPRILTSDNNLINASVLL